MTVGELMAKLATLDPSWPVTACVGPEGERVEISIVDFDVAEDPAGGTAQQIVILDG